MIKPLHGPAQLIAHNVTIGATAVLAERARAVKELPALDLDAVGEIPDLAIAVAWAAEEVFRYADAAPANVRAMVLRAGTLRMALLTNLDGAAQAKLVPQPLVDKIHVGRGPFDTAGDCVACAKLFKTYAAALKGKTPITAAQVVEAAELGTKLQTLLRPKGSKRKEKAQALKDAIDLRDWLGVLLAREYDEVRRAGGWLFGEDRDAKVPAPLASARPRRAKATDGGGAAPTTPAPATPAPTGTSASGSSAPVTSRRPRVIACGGCASAREAARFLGAELGLDGKLRLALSEARGALGLGVLGLGREELVAAHSGRDPQPLLVAFADDAEVTGERTGRDAVSVRAHREPKAARGMTLEDLPEMALRSAPFGVEDDQLVRADLPVDLGRDEVVLVHVQRDHLEREARRRLELPELPAPADSLRRDAGQHIDVRREAARGVELLVIDERVRADVRCHAARREEARQERTKELVDELLKLPLAHVVGVRIDCGIELRSRRHGPLSLAAGHVEAHARIAGCRLDF